MLKFSACSIGRRGPALWFRKAVPGDLLRSLGSSDIRRSLRTGDRRLARKRAWLLMLVIEDAFEALRGAGLRPDARDAFARILDQVMDDFDREGRQIGNRAKYRILMETLLQRGPLHAEDEIRVNPGPVAAEQPPITAAPVDIQEMIRTALLDAQIRPEARQMLSGRVPAYLEHKNKALRGNKHFSEIGTKIGLFIQTVGDKPIHAYRTDDICRFRDLLDQLPHAAKARFGTDNIQTAIDLNAARKDPFVPISPVTVDAKYLSAIRGLFGYLVDQKIIAHNPADGVHSEQDDDGDGLLDVEKRLPFTYEQCVAIDALIASEPRWSLDRWWWPLMRKAGLRLEEIAQLTPADFREHHGRLCIDLLHLDDGDPVNASRRAQVRIKSSAGRRVVPVQASLITEDRIEDLVAKRLREDGPLARLFPDETADPWGRLSSAASKRINRTVDRISTDRRYVGYSARHSFAAACDAAGVPADVRDAFMGHESDSTEDGQGSKRRGRRHVRRR